MKRGTGRSVVILFLAAIACQSTDAALLDEDGSLIAAHGPAPLAIAIAPAVFDPNLSLPADEKSLDLPDGGELRDLFLTSLEAMNACSQALPTGDPSNRDWDNRVDLVLVPTVRQASYTYDGMAGGAAAGSTALWLLTWIGGLLVPDAKYETRLAIDFEAIHPLTGEAVVGSAHLLSGSATLKFFERNDAASWGFLESLVFPPVLTHDDRTVLAATLRQRALDHLAAGTKLWLTGDLEATGIRLEAEPPNGASIPSGTVDLQCRIWASSEVLRVALYRDGVEIRHDFAEHTAPKRDDEVEPDASGRWAWIAHWSDLQLVDGTDLIQLYIELASGEIASRTIRWTVKL